VQIGTRIETLDDLRELPIIAAFSGFPQTPQLDAAAPAAREQSVISDVAILTYVDAPIASVSRTNGLPALAISITKTQDGNSVAVSRGVQDLVADLKSELSIPVEVVTIFDQAPFIEKSIEDLTIEGVLGLSFAVFVILVFLLSVKSTIITAVSIPSSVLITFIGLAVADYSLNILTLGALTIAIGRVVDDSIVVIENINRHLSYGEERREAIVTAVKEVAGAITASTITTVAVFLPIALVSGLVGELFRPFAFTVTIALLASLLVSLTIVPVLAYWFLSAPKSALAELARPPKGFAQRQRELEEAREHRSWLQRSYVPVLNGTRNHPWITHVSIHFQWL
jgi:HAE1 family hydrophobic/amphiphilic exporter-1